MNDDRAGIARTLGIARTARRRLAEASLLGAGAIGASIALMGTSAWLISRAAQRPSEASLTLAIVGVQFFGLSRGFFRYGERLVGHDAALRVLAGLRVRVFERLEAVAPAGLPVFRRGDLVARFVDDVDSLQDVVLRVLQPFLVATLVGAGTVAVLWWFLPQAGLVLLIALLLSATALPWLTGRLARREESRQAVVRGELTASVVDLVEGAPELLVMGAVGGQLARIDDSDSRLRRAGPARGRHHGHRPRTDDGAGRAGQLGRPDARGRCDTRRLAQRRPPCRPGARPAGRVRAGLAAARGHPGPPTLAGGSGPGVRGHGRAGGGQRSGDPGRAGRRPARAHLARGVGLLSRAPAAPRCAAWTCRLRAGRRVALVGPSGAGKSTLADVLVRFLPADAGEATLDGVPLERLAADDVRRVVGLVEQSPHLFDTTLAENLRVGRRTATDAELEDVLARVGLGPWLAGLPDGLRTPVGPQGGRLSGGQRQRVAVARALLADFPILVLDEPGEHLDPPAADALTADLLALTEGRSTLLITHRLTGLERVDEIVVLDGGRVVERGTHDELLLAGGRYAGLWWEERLNDRPADPLRRSAPGSRRTITEGSEQP